MKMSKDLTNTENNPLFQNAAFRERIKAQADKAREKATLDEEASGIPFISIKGGRLTIKDARVANDAMIGIILCERYEKTYYSQRYNPNEIVSPDCFALSDDKAALEPHKNSSKPQNTQCANCPNNEYETAKLGKGKACSDKIRLAILAVTECDDLDDPAIVEDPEFYKTAKIIYMKVPPASLKNYREFRKTIVRAQLPTHVVYTKITAKMDASNSYPEVTFEPYTPLSDMDILNNVEGKLKIAEEEIDTPYPAEQEAKESTKTEPSPAGMKKAKF